MSFTGCERSFTASLTCTTCSSLLYTSVLIPRPFQSYSCKPAWAICRAPLNVAFPPMKPDACTNMHPGIPDFWLSSSSLTPRHALGKGFLDSKLPGTFTAWTLNLPALSCKRHFLGETSCCRMHIPALLFISQKTWNSSAFRGHDLGFWHEGVVWSWLWEYPIGIKKKCKTDVTSDPSKMCVIPLCTEEMGIARHKQNTNSDRCWQHKSWHVTILHNPFAGLAHKTLELIV